MTPVERAIWALKQAGVDAREPAAHLGKCRTGYAVVYSGGDIPLGRTTRRIIVNVMLHVPVKSPEQLGPLRAAVQLAMRGVGFAPMGNGEDGVLEDYEAITCTDTYYALAGL